MIIVLITTLYILICISFILIFTKKLNEQSNDYNIDKSTLFISIIVAAKNEENTLPGLISSLAKLNYSKNKFEVIIVDDNSTDETFFITEELLLAFDNFRIVRAANKNYEGKRGALDYGISLAKYDNILITDADCKPGENWLKEINDKFISGCEFITGLAPFRQNQLFINKISCYENFRNNLLTVFANKIGLPFTASARNLALKKNVFQKIEGYKNTVDTLSGDDDLLLREAVKNKSKICTLATKDSFVYSETKQSFKDYFTQRARHTQTSFHYLLKQSILLFLWHTLNIIFLLSPLLAILDLIYIVPFIVKIFFDLLISILYQERLSYKFSLIETFYLQFFYEIFLIVHIFNSGFRKIKWK